MRVLFPVRPGRYNVELRYSLRSLANIPHDGVIVSGYVATNLRNVQAIHRPQRDGKYANAWGNVYSALTVVDDDELLLFNDDIYALSAADPTITYTAGPLNAVIAHKKKQGIGTRHLTNVADVLDGDLLAYNLHVPMPINREAMIEVIDKYDVIRQAKRHHIIDLRTLYGNHVQAGGTVIPDCKVHNGSEKEFNSKISDLHPYLSTADTAMKGFTLKFLETMFPDRCEYEGPTQIRAPRGR
jgi:hypothetical protein